MFVLRNGFQIVCPEKWISDLVPGGWCLIAFGVICHILLHVAFGFFKKSLLLFWDLYDQSFGSVKLGTHLKLITIKIILTSFLLCT